MLLETHHIVICMLLLCAGNSRGYPIIKGQLTEIKDAGLPWEFCKLYDSENVTLEYEKDVAFNGYILDCQLDKKQWFKLTDLKEWLENIKKPEHELALIFQCNSLDGKVDMPWAMNIKNIVYVDINGCTVSNFYAGYHEQETLQWNNTRQSSFDIFQHDQRRVFVAKHSILSVTMEMLKVSVINYPSPADCGALKAHTHVFHNVTHKTLQNNSSNGPREFENLWNEYLVRRANVRIKCQYKNLRYLDWSGNSWYTANDMRTSTDTSTYPALVFCNLSHTSVQELPDKIRRWGYTFPKLKQLDLSYSKVNTFDIKDNRLSSVNNNQHIVNINLQHTKISKITQKDIERLEKLTTFFIDVRYNKIECDCDLMPVIDKLKNEGNSTFKASGKYHYLLELECQNQSGTKLKNIAAKDICPTVNHTLIVAIVAFLLVFLTCLAILLIVKNEHKIKPFCGMDEYEKFNESEKYTDLEKKPDSEK